MKITIKELNVVTGEEIIIERDETPAETKLRLAEEKEIAQKQADLATKETARAAILERLGLTAEEAALLLP
jgi:hypothetical protein